MSSDRLVRNDHLVLIAVISTLVIASPSISNYGYFGFTKVVYGQSDPNQMNSNTTNSVNIQDIPVKKVHVGDIDVAYKMFGKGDPILLINGASDGMSAWDPSLLKTLSSNHTVIVFDPRGIGNTTIGSKPYTSSTTSKRYNWFDGCSENTESRCYGIFSWIIYSPTGYDDASR